jgi:WD40 repeat protein
MEHENHGVYPHHGLWTCYMQYILSRRSACQLRKSSLFAISLTRVQIAIGTKTGEIEIYNLASSSLVDTADAHSGTVWSLHVRPDGQSLVSGSADKTVKFWEFGNRASDGDNVRTSHVFLPSLPFL